MPDAPIVVIQRDPEEVVDSLARAGWGGGHAQLERMKERAAQLADLAEQPGVLAFPFSALAIRDVCAAVYERCLGVAMDPAWWSQIEKANIQVDAREAQRLIANRPRTDLLKAEVRCRQAPRGIHVSVEPWSTSFWTEAEALASAHFAEVEQGVEPRRHFKLDQAMMGALVDSGILRMITARSDGELIGYFTWNVVRDVQSEGLLIAQQGAWYLAQGYPRVAAQMFDASVAELRRLGVKCIYPHHRTQGRGAAIGRFFQRRGARETQRTYSLWIGGD